MSDLSKDIVQVYDNHELHYTASCILRKHDFNIIWQFSPRHLIRTLALGKKKDSGWYFVETGSPSKDTISIIKYTAMFNFGLNK